MLRAQVPVAFSRLRPGAQSKAILVRAGRPEIGPSAERDDRSHSAGRAHMFVFDGVDRRGFGVAARAGLTPMDWSARPPSAARDNPRRRGTSCGKSEAKFMPLTNTTESRRHGDNGTEHRFGAPFRYLRVSVTLWCWLWPEFAKRYSFGRLLESSPERA